MSAFEGLGEAIRWLRSLQGRKQYELAEAAGITKGMLSGYENQQQNPSLATLARILDALGVSVTELGQALVHVRRRKAGEGPTPFLSPPGRTYPAPEEVADREMDVRRLLGIDEPLSREEEQALTEIVRGQLRLARAMYTASKGFSRPAPSHQPDPPAKPPRSPKPSKKSRSTPPDDPESSSD